MSASGTWYLLNGASPFSLSEHIILIFEIREISSLRSIMHCPKFQNFMRALSAVTSSQKVSYFSPFAFGASSLKVIAADLANFLCCAFSGCLWNVFRATVLFSQTKEFPIHHSPTVAEYSEGPNRRGGRNRRGVCIQHHFR